jgi:hypothetical protein
LKKRDFTELWTYGTYDSLNDTDFGMSFEVPKKWLKTKINEYRCKTLSEFYTTYTWDTTINLHIEAENEGVLLTRKCGMFGHELYKKDINQINL